MTADTEARLTEAQRRALIRYDGLGVTAAAYGSTATFNALVRKGYLIRSYGPGAIEAEITALGRAALARKEG